MYANIDKIYAISEMVSFGTKQQELQTFITSLKMHINTSDIY